MLAVLALAALAQSPPAVVLGATSATYRVSPGLSAPTYRNAGFAQSVDGDRLSVRLDLSPGFSREPYPLPDAVAAGTEVPATVRWLAVGAVADSRSEDEAVVRILEAVAKRLTYEAAAPAATASAEEALARGRANCVGYSNLAVAALGAAGIPARVVRGLLLDDQGRATPHRWIEVHYADAGWIFSDPIASVNYVDRRHVLLRLPGREESDYDPAPFLAAPFRTVAVDGALLVVDRAVGEGRLARRRNLQVQGGAAVAGYARGGSSGLEVRLLGHGQALTTELDHDLSFSFLDIAPGRYTLTLSWPGGGELRQPVEVEPYGLRVLRLSLVAR